MKMETIIRSPQRGTVAKLVHKPGVCTPFCWKLLYQTNHENEQDICKAGTVLVLFEETE